MNRTKIFLSFFLSLIFVFPSIYQSIHVFQIHWNTNTAHTCSCQDIKETNNDYRYTYPQETKKSCPVCEFEFASFNKIKNIKLGAIRSDYIDVHLTNIQEIYFSNYNEVITLRGPPFHSLT